MKNLIYTFKLENEEGMVITSVVIDTYKNAYYVISRLLEEGLFEIKAPAILTPISVTDYDC